MILILLWYSEYKYYVSEASAHLAPICDLGNITNIHSRRPVLLREDGPN